MLYVSYANVLSHAVAKRFVSFSWPVVSAVLFSACSNLSGADAAALSVEEGPLGDVVVEMRALQEELAKLRQQMGKLEQEHEALQSWQKEANARLDACGCHREDAEDLALGTDVALDEPAEKEDHEAALVDGESSQAEADTYFSVNVRDEEWVKEVFFSGKPWIIHCLDKRTTVKQEVPDVFKDSAFQYRANATFGTLACWERLPSSKKTLAQRFGLPRPPVTFAVANGDAPVPLDLQGIVKPWQFMRQAGPHLRIQVTRVDTLARFKTYCSRRKACLVVGYRTEEALAAGVSAITPALEEHRGVRAVAVDSTIWRFRFDERLVSSRPVAGSTQADLLCLARSGGPAGGSRRAGAFLRPPLPPARAVAQGLTEASHVRGFLERCLEGKGLVQISETPWISHREKAREKSRPPSGGGTTAASGNKKEKKKPTGRRDHVGPRPKGLEEIEIKDDPVRVYGNRDEEEYLEL